MTSASSSPSLVYCAISVTFMYSSAVLDSRAKRTAEQPSAASTIQTCLRDTNRQRDSWADTTVPSGRGVGAGGVANAELPFPSGRGVGAGGVANAELPFPSGIGVGAGGGASAELPFPSGIGVGAGGGAS